MGRPILATRVPGCSETYDDGKTGLGCEVYDTTSLLSSMEKFLQLPHNVKEHMGELGRKKIASEFNRNIVIEKYLNSIFE